MEQLISSGSTRTILNDLETFKIINEYKHENFDKSDLQFFGKQKFFLHAGLNDFKFFRIHKEDETETIKLVRKIRVAEATCIACPKIDEKIFAAGLSTGNIIMMDCRKSDIVYKYNSNYQKNSVTFLDLSYCNNYLSSIHENGKINIYGLRTHIKFYEFPIDDKHVAMVSRFHPSQQLKLGIGSYSGRVSLFDLVSKSLIYENSDAHEMPCADISISPKHTDCLVSAGYDGLLNICDIRKKKIAYRIIQKSPINTISHSYCGNYLASGNMVGGVYVYDLRNVSKELIRNQIHDGKINRIAFVPQTENANTTLMTIKAENRRESLLEGLEKKSTSTPPSDDSFYDVFGMFQNNRCNEVSPKVKYSTTSRLSMESSFGNDFFHQKDKNFSELNTSEAIANNLEFNPNIKVNSSAKNDNWFVNTSRLEKHRKQRSKMKQSVIVANVIKEEPINENQDQGVGCRKESLSNIQTKHEKIVNESSKKHYVDVKENKIIALENSVLELKKDIKDIVSSVHCLQFDLGALNGNVFSSCYKYGKALEQLRNDVLLYSNLISRSDDVVRDCENLKEENDELDKLLAKFNSNLQSN